MLHGDLLSDPELERELGDERFLVTAIEVERALTFAQADCGVIPVESAEAVERALAEIELRPDAILEDAARDGVFVPAMVRHLRASLEPGLASCVHRGATSQDVTDTATVLVLRRASKLISERMTRAGDTIAQLAEQHAATAMLSRTRMQQAAVTTFGCKAAGWLAPFVRHRERLAEAERRLFCVSLGGASGNQSALGDKARETELRLAERLGLGGALAPWHTQRDSVIEFGNCLCLIAGCCAKAALDLILLGQSEIGEVRDKGGGGSSTLPQKSNPVRAEAVLALARHARAQLGSLHQAAEHEHERGGAGWMLEWLALPPLVIAAGAALRHLGDVVEDLEIDAGAMQRNVEASRGLVLAEAATFLLARELPLAEARALVKDACRRVAGGSHLFDLLAEETPRDTGGGIDWEREKDPARHVGQAPALAARIVAAWRDRAAQA